MITAKERLMKFLRQYPSEFIRTSEIMRWGSNGGFSNRAARDARELASGANPFIQRLSREEAILHGFTTKEGIYKILYK